MNLELVQPLAAAVFAFLLVYLVVPLLVKIAHIKNLFDSPDGERKIHTRLVPSLGGVALFSAVLVGTSVSGFAEQIAGFPYWVAALVLLFFTGLKDDLVGLSPGKKLATELTASGFIIFGSGVIIDDLYGLFGLHELPLWASVPLTLFTLIVVLNSYNLIDGIDGLAGGIGLLATLFFGGIFWVCGLYPLAVLALITAASLLGFLMHNFRPARIFMGDSGSLVIGFLLGVMAIELVALGDHEQYIKYFGNTSTVLPAIFLVIPLFDTLRVFLRRIRNNRSPFSPDTDHIHHVLLSSGFSHARAAAYLYTAMFLIIMIAFGVRALEAYVVLGVALFSAVLLLPTDGIKRALLRRFGINISSRTLIKNEHSKAPNGEAGEKKPTTATPHANGNGKSRQKPINGKGKKEASEMPRYEKQETE